jgi:hypothetical protein
MRAMKRLAAAVIATTLLAACGGSGPGSPHGTSSAGHRGIVPIGAPCRGPRAPGLMGGATSAGIAPSYRPTGRILANSGFRPQVNGFSFENSGNDAGPVNLTPQNVEDLFGPQVCAAGEGASCTLIPPARHWMQQVNASMADGHCMGFSVTALRFFSRNLAVDSYGASRAISLPVQGNDALQSLIAEGFAYQDLPSVIDHAIVGTPVQVLGALIHALRAGRELYTLAIIRPDGSGGHAITPFAVEDRGDGRIEILAYDNNFPGIVRALDVNTRLDTWHYVGGINPADTSEVYSGDAQTRTIALLPTTPGERQQPRPFCSSGKLPGKPSVLDNLRYIVYHLPLGHPDIKVLIDSSGITRPATTQLQVNGAGLVFYVQDIRMAPGQQDAMALPATRRVPPRSRAPARGRWSRTRASCSRATRLRSAGASRSIRT